MSSDPDTTAASTARVGSRRQRSAGAATIVLLGLGLYLPGIGWGLPAMVSWSQDTIATPRRIGAVEGWPGDWKGRYPPLHYLLLDRLYQGAYKYWSSRGECSTDPTTGQRVLAPPQAPKVGRLLLIARAGR